MYVPLKPLKEREGAQSGSPLDAAAAAAKLNAPVAAPAPRHLAANPARGQFSKLS